MENKIIDLGLPSGTLWTENNEDGYYGFDKAFVKYGDRLPTKEQFEELINYCKWKWNKNAYKITGPNGNIIILPAMGYSNGDKYVNYVNFFGTYWSTTPKDSDNVWSLKFNSGNVCMDYYGRSFSRSVRLVKKKEDTTKNKNNDMENKELNIAEILKDCPKGTKLYATTVGECTFEGIINDSKTFPIMVQADSYTYRFNAYGKFLDVTEAECQLFPSKENRDWSTFNVRQNFKKGDFVARVYDDDDPIILLMGETDWSSPNNQVRYICYVDLSAGTFCVSKSIYYWCSVNTFYDEDDRYRLATDDEKKKLLDVINEYGYVWDEEKLELRKKEPEFKPFDKVLVRDFDNERWMTGLFSHIVDDSDYGYEYAANGVYWKMCIPYEGNERLLGTSNSK